MTSDSIFNCNSLVVNKQVDQHSQLTREIERTIVRK